MAFIRDILSVPFSICANIFQKHEAAVRNKIGGRNKEGFYTIQVIDA